jgi:hypothetical protein
LQILNTSKPKEFMPIYEYGCNDCGATFELLLEADANNPSLCGFRCKLKRGSNDDLRGNGSLYKKFSTFQQVSEVTTTNHPDPEKAAKFGFTTYQNNGNGTFQKVAGKSGPDQLKR